MLCLEAFILAVAALAVGCQAAVVTYDWNVTWVQGAPDGYSRPIIGVNNAWPCPIIEASLNDTIVVHLTNLLGNETTGLHFHGFNMVDTPWNDGASGVNQCSLPPGHSITYEFKADVAGTFWWHSHNMAQYPDGLRGPLIVHDPNDPYAGTYDEDIIMTVSDWYHDQSPKLVSAMLKPNNTLFQPPRPNSILVNDGGNGKIYVDCGKTYRFRIINFAALTASFVHFAEHTMDIIMIDATNVKRQTAESIRVSPAERYDVLVTIDEGETEQNFPYLFALDTNQDFTSPNPPQPIQYAFNFTGVLVVDEELPTEGLVDEVAEFAPYDDAKLVPYDSLPAYGPVDKYWVLDFNYCTDVNGYPRACFNGTTFIGQKVPTLYSASSLGADNVHPEAYGQVIPLVVEYGDVVEIVVNNQDISIHPFHLHGHQFQILDRPFSGAGDWVATTVNPVPPRRDTVTVFAKSYAALRIQATNPGVWLFHCHIEWHVEMGLTATLISSPLQLENLPFPQDHLDVCEVMGTPTTGNAAGNADWYNTTGFITVPPTQYYGALYPAPTS